MAAQEYNARSLARMGRAISALRRARGLTQAELAARAGVSRQWIISLEKGGTRGLEMGLVMQTLDELDASLYIRDDLEAER